MRGEFRERMEGFDGLGFNDTREDLYYLSRLRLNATFIPARQLSFQVQAQDARVASKTVGPTGTPFRAPFDMRMAFADVGTAQSRLALRVGRQELVYGEQRLVGHVGWVNAARTFDAAKTDCPRQTRLSSMCLARRSSAFSRESSTRAAPETGSPGRMRLFPRSCRPRRSSLTRSGSATSTC